MTRFFRTLRAAALHGLLLLALAACAAGRPAANPELPYPPPRPPQVGDILHLRTGLYVSEAALHAALADVRIVYCGETHDNPASHRLQERLLRALQTRNPGGVALGMEMFTPGQQEVLDRWSAGELEEKEFLKQVRWYEVWKQDFAYYRDLLHLAREWRIPVIGLNAPRDLVKAVGRTPLAELDEETRARLPEMDFSDPYQKGLVQAIYGGHDEGEAMLDGFLRVQTLWDESMAENIVRYLDSPQGEGRQLLVVAGGNHIRYGFGIPRRVFRRLPLSYALLSGSELTSPEEKQAQPGRYMDVTLPRFPMPAADYLAFIPYEKLPEKVKLGVQLETVAQGLKVVKLVPGAAAELAGLQAGDILTALDGEPLAESFDLVYLIERKAPGDRVSLQFLRDDQPLERTAELQPLPAPSPQHPR